MEERYSDPIAEQIPPRSAVTWSAGGPGRREAVRIEHAGGGYDGGDPEAAAEWATHVVMGRLGILRSDPIDDLEQQVQTALPGRQVTPTDEVDDDSLE